MASCVILHNNIPLNPPCSSLLFYVITCFFQCHHFQKTAPKTNKVVNWDLQKQSGVFLLNVIDMLPFSSFPNQNVPFGILLLTIKKWVYNSSSSTEIISTLKG